MKMRIFQEFFTLGNLFKPNKYDRFWVTTFKYLHDDGKVGDTVYVDGGYGDFFFTKEMGASVVLVSGGINTTSPCCILVSLLVSPCSTTS